MSEESDDFDLTVPIRRGESTVPVRPGESTVPVRRGESAEMAARREREAASARRDAVLRPGGVATTGRGVPVVYGARPAINRTSAPSPEAVALEPGASHTGADAALAARAGLPSFELRERRLGSLTVALYAAVTVLSVLGLCALAMMVMR